MKNSVNLVDFFDNNITPHLPNLSALFFYSILGIFSLTSPIGCAYLPAKTQSIRDEGGHNLEQRNLKQHNLEQRDLEQKKSTELKINNLETDHDLSTTNNIITAPKELPGKERPIEMGSSTLDKNQLTEEQHTGQRIEAETLYDLIVAEMASKENRLDITLGNYLKQAHYTKDPKIIARATRIAKYMAAHQATLDAAKLWLEVEPDNIEAHQAVTVQLIRHQQYNEALLHIDKLLILSGEPNFDFLIHHSRRISKEARQDIIDGLSTLTAKHPSNARLWFTKAILEDLQGARNTALESTTRSLELEPNYVTAKIFKAKTQQALGQPEEALKTLKQAVRKHSSHRRLRIVYARLLISQNKLGKAQEQFEYLIKRNPEDSDLILSLALLSWENKLDKQAKKYLYQLLKTGKRIDDAHTYLGQILASEKKYDEALKHYQQVKIGPSYATAQIQQALVYSEMDQVEKSIEGLHQAMKNRPQSEIQFIITESEILIKENRLDEAYTQLNNALKNAPEDSNLLYSRAMLAEKLDNLDQLEVDLRLIIQSEPDSALALNALGYTLADRSNRLEEALDLINKAATIEPNDPAIIDSLGWVHYKLGNNDIAIQHLRKAYELFNDHEIAAHLGEVLWVNGLKREAEALWKSSASKFPDSTILKKVMDRFLK